MKLVVAIHDVTPAHERAIFDLWALCRSRDVTPALLVVPSAIVPEECNVLINPLHADSAGISAGKVRRWLYDPRLVRSV